MSGGNHVAQDGPTPYEEPIPCVECNGTGHVQVATMNEDGEEEFYTETCEACKGDGIIYLTE